MRKKQESLQIMTPTESETYRIEDIEFTVDRDTEKAIKEFKECLIDFTVAVTADIKKLAKDGKNAEGLKILASEDKAFDRAMKILERQELLIKVLRFDEETKDKKVQSRVSVEAMAK